MTRKTDQQLRMTVFHHVQVLWPDTDFNAGIIDEALQRFQVDDEIALTKLDEEAYFELILSIHARH